MLSNVTYLRKMALFAAACLVVCGRVHPLKAEEQPAGQRIFAQEKCGTCHSVASADIEAKTKSEKMKGPDLGGYETEDPAALLAYLRKEEAKNGKKHLRAAKSSDEELEALLDWLVSLESATP
ncbi:MAG: c-type cytochrome [Acidobacteriota bacterium]